MSEEKPVSVKRTAKKAAAVAKPVAGKKVATTQPKGTVRAKTAGKATVAPTAATVKPVGKAPATAAPKARAAAVVREPVAPKKAVAASPAAASASGKPGRTGKTAGAIKPVDKPPAPSHAERRRWIATAAYLRAEKRGFAPGYELQDWLEAEAEIEHLIGKGT
jgi:hypothetical protein